MAEKGGTGALRHCNALGNGVPDARPVLSPPASDSPLDAFPPPVPYPDASLGERQNVRLPPRDNIPQRILEDTPR